jgi:cytochrome c-type biogenesis protein CcsB
MSAEVTIANAAGLSSVAAFWVFVIGSNLRRAHQTIERLGAFVMMICFTCVNVALIMRTIEAARFPIANLYESLLLFAWSMLAAYFLLRRTYSLNNLGWLTALSVSTIFLYANWLPASQHDVAPLMPALVSNWRAIHVPPLIVSYALLTLGGLLAVGHLWTSNRRSTAIASVAAIAVSVSCTAIGAFASVKPLFLQLWFWGGTAVCLAVMAFTLKAERLNPVSDSSRADLYDEISQRCISIAFPLLTFGIITGALWANHAWGSYWSFDPKESMSLATWFSYAAYLHLRAKADMSDASLSVVAVLGLLLTLVTYFGFSFLGFGGLHSYGQLSK